MDIVDLSGEYEDSYCKCLESWSEEMKEAGERKKNWLEKKRSQGLRVKLAVNEKNETVGMIQYVPIEHAPAHGKDLYYIYCVWVHGYKEGQGNYQKRGIGTRLLEAAEADARSLGAKGMAAWGITLPFFMRSKWFRKHGYAHADRDGMIELVWKRFGADGEPPKMLKRKKTPETGKGTVTVTCLRNGWCPAQNLSCERMKRAAAEYGDEVKLVEIDTEAGNNLEEWGISDGIFVDSKSIVTGPPPSFEKLRKILRKRVEKVKR